MNSIDQKEISIVQESWSNFETYWWIVFTVHVVMSRTQVVENLLEPGNIIDVVINVIIAGIPAILMIIYLSYYAYKFSGRKSNLLVGLAGFSWISSLVAVYYIYKL